MAHATAAALADPRLLALITFGTDRPAPDDPRVAWVPLADAEASGANEPAFEAWFGTAPVTAGRDGGIAFASDGALLFGHLHLEEAAAWAGLGAATRLAYDQILAGLRDWGFPHLLRIWHFFPDIGGASGDLDRYQVFCRGRFAALAHALPESEAALPAASALGSHAPGLAIQFLAASRPGRQIENPRQISAFRYPPQYGPRSPSFSRSMLMPLAPGTPPPLLISGTASIVGHRTCHPSDAKAQLIETLHNLDALLTAAEEHAQRPFRVGSLRAYLRPPADAKAMRAGIAGHFGGDVPVLLLAADICRRDLLLEIEGVAYADPD